ncbi:MAG: GntR family transcriptional regulator [Anaerohalosphaera sp.]|nr:GntR family transcriptional regulator [Anaerohalosphaera sp.]
MTDNIESNPAATHLSMNDILETVHFRVRNKHSNNRLSDAVYEHILKELVFPDGQDQLQIGSKITESMIATDLRVSNGPVRDAMARLRREGWIITLHNRGSYVVDFTLPENSREIYKFRLSVEAGAFYTLAETITDEQLNELKSCTMDTERAVGQGDLAAYRKADAEFHLKVLEMAGGRSLRDLAAPKFLQWFAVSRLILKDMFNDDRNILSKPSGSHEDLCQLLANHDGTGAAELITHHCSYVAQLLGIEE